jgi:hypothetical protein
MDEPTEEPPEQSSTPRREVRTRTRALSIGDLARQIEIEHRAFVDAATNAMEKAIRCGKLLLQAKARVGHGGWLDWIKEHLSFGARQAQKYMSIAQHPELANANSNSYLTIDGALPLIAAQRCETPTPTTGGDPAVPARAPKPATTNARASRTLTRPAVPDHLAQLQSALAIFTALPQPNALARVAARRQAASLLRQLTTASQYITSFARELRRVD